jgi:hypothetical protein
LRQYKLKKDEEGLYEDLTKVFIEYQHRLENPMPTSVADFVGGAERYQRDGMFHAKVKNLVAGVIGIVMDNLEELN